MKRCPLCDGELELSPGEIKNTYYCKNKDCPIRDLIINSNEDKK